MSPDCTFTHASQSPPMQQESLELHRETCLYDALRISGNRSMLASDALEAIKVAFHVL
jgi:hypothetical protein